MTRIHLTNFISAPVERVFDLCRSISLHKISMEANNEIAIAGTVSGLINENETVTWQAKHFFKTRQFTSRITAMQRPVFFIDDMVKGDFKSFHHEHHFKTADNGTIMIDIVDFESPYGLIGKIGTAFYLKPYLEKLLSKRNDVIKEYAESQKWKAILT